MPSIPLLIDGGFSTQLAIHKPDENVDDHPLWVARYLVLDPNACVSVSKDFIRGGSKVVRTNTYQLSMEGFKKHLNMSEDDITAVVYSSVDYCRKAIREQKHPEGFEVLIAGSVGPYGACLHDGSEYTGSYCDSITSEELIEWHRWRLSNLIKAGVNLLAIETIPCSIEALALVDLLKEFPEAKAWLSFSLKNEAEISNGEKFADVAKKVWDRSNGQIVAVGVNCCKPDFVLPILNSLKAIDKSIPFIAYPNKGETYDPVAKKWIERGDMGKVADFVSKWLSVKKFAYIGACCRNTSDDIATIGQTLKTFYK